MSLDYYSEIFKQLLLRKVVIKCGTKIYRTGKIKNFDIRQFYIKLFIENNKNNIKLVELPYPYIITTNGSTTTLNYHTSAFCNTTSKPFAKINLFDKSNTSKFYNNLIEIITVE
jgi:hypothetical protein